MAKPANRSQLMAYLGAVQTNPMWSWCGVNEEERKVYFSVWADHVSQVAGVPTYTLQEPHWGVGPDGRHSAARNDQDKKLALVFDQGYEAWAYFVEAKDRRAVPREIESTRTGFVLQLQVSRADDGSVTGTAIRRVEIR